MNIFRSRTLIAYIIIALTLTTSRIALAPLLNQINRPGRFQPLPLTTIRCDRQYSSDMADTLVQFSGMTDPKRLKEYGDYMIMVKQYVDLGYMIRPYEQSLTSEQRSILRTPMQNYVTCRTTTGSTYGYGVQQFAPPKKLLSPCESQYAFEVQTTLNELEKKMPTFYLLAPMARDECERYLIGLKHYEDLGFSLADFEKRTPTEIIYKLRAPMRRYDKCIDTVIQLAQPQLLG